MQVSRTSSGTPEGLTSSPFLHGRSPSSLTKMWINHTGQQLITYSTIFKDFPPFFKWNDDEVSVQSKNTKGQETLDKTNQQTKKTQEKITE